MIVRSACGRPIAFKIEQHSAREMDHPIHLAQLTHGLFAASPRLRPPRPRTRPLRPRCRAERVDRSRTADLINLLAPMATAGLSERRPHAVYSLFVDRPRVGFNRPDTRSYLHFELSALECAWRVPPARRHAGHRRSAQRAASKPPTSKTPGDSHRRARFCSRRHRDASACCCRAWVAPCWVSSPSADSFTDVVSRRTGSCGIGKRTHRASAVPCI